MTRDTDDTRLVTILLIIIGAFVVIPMSFMGFGMMGFGPMMGGMWGGGTWGTGMASGWLFIVGIAMQLLVLVAVIGGGYLLYKMVAGDDRASDQALEELRLAYARGELTDDEYEQRRDELERGSESQ